MFVFLYNNAIFHCWGDKFIIKFDYLMIICIELYNRFTIKISSKHDN
jgi:hypothetical protein